MGETAQTTEQPRDCLGLYREKMSDQMRRLVEERDEVKEKFMEEFLAIPTSGERAIRWRACPRSTLRASADKRASFHTWQLSAAR
jgi:hypothetical protein